MTSDRIKKNLSWPVPRRRAALALALVLSGALSLGGCSSSDDDSAFQLQLLHFADVDGGGTAAMFNVDEFSALLSHFRGKMPERTLFLSTGDNYIPGPIFEASADPRMAAIVGTPGQGRGEIEIMNRMGLQASTVGNHDLDTGPSGFAGIIAPSGEWRGAQFPYLAVNIDFTTETTTNVLLQPSQQEASSLPPGALTSSVVLTVDGERIGFVGAVTPTLPSITSVGRLLLSPAPFVEDAAGFDALAKIIQDEVDKLTAAGINKIILGTHMQRINVERNLAPRLRDVDIIIGGGSNTIFADSNDLLREGDTAGANYPEFYTSASGEPVLLVNTDADYKYLGRLIVDFDEDGVILIDKLDSGKNGAWAAIPAVVEQLKAEPIPEVVAAASVIREILAEQDGSAFGFTKVFLDGRRGSVRSRETNLGNISADANLWYGAQLDPENPPVISIKNGGGIRAPIGTLFVPPGAADEVVLLPPAANDFGKPEGGVSQLDIQTSLAFNNGLAVVDMTACEVYDLIEFSILGNFSHTAGLVAEFDPTRQARTGGDTNKGCGTDGRRIQSLAVNTADGVDILVRDGVFVGNQAATYRVIALDFMNNCAAPANDPRNVPNCGSSYPFKGLASANYVNLVVDDRTPADRATTLEARDPGEANFSNTGGEQDAMAEYMRAFHGTVETAFDKPIDVNERLIPIGR
ncbi:MAG: 5'-nucleotidase C-terminal domain-containing protein [Thioalkalivibrionaceae bacterium]